MLSTLTVQNIALIDRLEVQFHAGLNILSGETGAGKSIIIDSLNFVLGGRADKNLIKYGTDFAKVDAEYDIEDKTALQNLLEEYGIVKEDTLLLSRHMSKDGVNACRINGQKVTLGMLRSVAELLIDIYGQHETAAVLKEAQHIRILDGFSAEVDAPLKAYQESYHAYKALLKKLERYGDLKNISKNIDILEYQIQEISRADLKEGEEEELRVLRSKILNQEQYLGALTEARTYLSGFEQEPSALSLLNQAVYAFGQAAEFDPAIPELLERMESIKIELADIADTVSFMSETTEFDAHEAERVEARWNLIKSLKKKYGESIDDILRYCEKLQEEFAFLSDSEEQLSKLQAELVAEKNRLAGLARVLTDTRKRIAKEMEKRLIEELNEVGMKNTRFEVVFEEPDLERFDAAIRADGVDQLAFYIAINKGQPLKPLAKTISGGEMSRFMLCLKNITATLEEVGTLVFDEIDSGISGHTALVVAQKMYKISKMKQVLAVTHLPQLASMADTNYLITKSSDAEFTHTKLECLDAAGAIREIARLIGGLDSSSAALAHATEMKAFANNFKKLAE